MQDVVKTRTRKRSRLKPSQLEYKGEMLKPTPLIFEQQHRNIATLIVLMAAIIFGLGAGWMAGGFINNTASPDLPEGAAQRVEASQTLPLAEKGDEAESEAQAEAQQVETQSDSQLEARKHNGGETARAASSRHATYTARKGESIPIKVLKGKPLKKVAKQFKRLKVW